MNQLLQVPASLLTDPDLPASAKLVHMVARLWPGAGPPGPGWLVETSGLSRPTVLKALSLLPALGYHRPAVAQRTADAHLPAETHGPATEAGPTVPVPADLLTNRSLSIQARVLYGLLLLTPGFHHPGGRFTYEGLARLAHTSPNTVAHAMAELTRAECLTCQRTHPKTPIYFELTFPGLDRALSALAAAERRLGQAPFFGEALMREFLTLLVDSDQYEDDAAPGFLVNPRTQERLEFDRYYPPAVAFEFNGPHHYADPSQRERDYIKLGICAERGITLVVIHTRDLSLNKMREKVGGLLPLRELTGHQPVIDFLEAEARRYRRSNRKLQ